MFNDMIYSVSVFVACIGINNAVARAVNS